MRKETYRYIADNLRLAASKLDELGEISEADPTSALVGLALVMSVTGRACHDTEGHVAQHLSSAGIMAEGQGFLRSTGN